jgi:hypothetical protein
MCEPGALQRDDRRCSAACPLAVAIAPTPPSSAGDPLLEHAHVGFEIASNVAGALHVEERRRVVGIRKDE